MTTVARKVTDKDHLVLDFGKCEKIFEPWLQRQTGADIASPVDICAVEKARNAYGICKCKSCPVDLFVWSKGNPAKRFLTQIGGIPFFPKDRDWPKDESGVPYVFVAQISFVDSKDVLPITLPGDVLLIFARKDLDGYAGFAFMGEEDELHFEWVDKNCTSLWSKAQFEKDGEKSMATSSVNGVIYRSFDYHVTKSITERLWADYKQEKVGRYDLIPIFCGTKIGGFPAFIQDGPHDFNLRNMTWKGARFIAQLSSIQGTDRFPFSLCDDKDYGFFEPLMIGDMGSIYLFLEPNGNVIWTDECY